jgi:MFS-type transporter involved in bile tolerance (Atg22 family)
MPRQHDGNFGPGMDITLGTIALDHRLTLLWVYSAISWGNGPTYIDVCIVFQSLLFGAGFDRNDPTKDCSDPTVPCVVKFGASIKDINSVVLVCSGIVCAFQGFILIFFGSMSDYGSTKKWVLIACTLVCWAAQFGFLGLSQPIQYRIAAALFILASKNNSIPHSCYLRN